VGEIIFITGTDTGVGKTILTAFLLHHLRRKKVRALALKPFCTGSRADVEILQELQPGELSNTEVNPYFFPEPLAPYISAKKHRQNIVLADVLEKISKIKKRCDVLLVEGAGGIMVPLGADFLIRDLIAELRCQVIIVARNQLGTINHTLLSASALQIPLQQNITIVTVDSEKPDLSSKTNRYVLKKFLVSARFFSIPFLGKDPSRRTVLEKNYKKIKKTLAVIIKCV
jgi:dethiobiotin synthetase